jgi:hypothetical protein
MKKLHLCTTYAHLEKPNEEVKSTRESGRHTDLFIVHSIDLREESVHIASGGKLNLIEDWFPLENDLTALSYRYRVPRKK